MSRNTLSTHIEEKLDVLTQIDKECCMYKVPEQLRDVNENAYKPTLLAIGPYHHGKVGQRFMEEHKLRYLKQLLERTGGSVETYIAALRRLEDNARKCYVECISQTSDEFVKMMLLDGCFIIELFRKYKKTIVQKDDPICQTKWRDQEYDPIFQTEWMLPTIGRDLLLFENQLPFFVLAKLFDMSESNRSRNLEEVDGEEIDEISIEISPIQLNDLVLDFFSDTIPFEWNVNTSSYNSIKRITYLHDLKQKALTHSLPDMVSLVGERLIVGHKFKYAEFEHLLGLIHATIYISILDIEIDNAKECQEAGVKFKKTKIFKDLFGLICKAVIALLVIMKIMRKTERTEIDDWNIHSATELEEAGIIFKKAKKSNFFAIKFNNGQLEIPPLSIEDDTETYFRNLIAYEQYCDPQNGSSYVYNYVRFMDRLINSPKDVELLRRKGIISNCLGGDEIISTMVNKLGHYVSFSTNIYDGISKNLNEHCNKSWNLWMAKLRHDYFNSPWALLSCLAAILLLLLAIAQTIFSIIP